MALLGSRPAAGLLGASQEALILANYERYYTRAASRAVVQFSAGRIVVPAGMTWKTVLGQLIDKAARNQLRAYLAREGIAEGPGAGVRVNRWLVDPAGSGAYRIPDVLLAQRRLILGGTIGSKTLSDAQIRDFVAFSGGFEVKIVRPQMPMFTSGRI